MFFIFFTLIPIYGQMSLDTDQPERIYERAMLEFDRGHYGLARELFGSVVDAIPDILSTLKSDAAFYEALSSFRLGNNDAAYKFEKYLETYPHSSHLSHSRFCLGELAHDRERFRNAIRWYDKVDANALDRDVRNRYYFKAGYANFMEGDFDRAAPLFARIKDVPTDWWAPSNYYYAHIQYEKGNHDQALNTFIRLKDERGFETIIPYYIAQIHYIKGDYDKAIEYGTPLMKNASGVMRTDLARVIGDSWFVKGDYKQVIPMLSIVVTESSSPRREDYYHLGVAYYFTANYEEAANYLAQVTSGDDEMTQNAYYHLADCYLKLLDKKNARVAFEAASRYNFNEKIKEEAMFNYIKLSYELSFSPFNEIINLFLQFIDEYPQSVYNDEAYQYLGQALLTTRNYREALGAMEKIKQKNRDVYQAMQRVSYYRGLELFTNLQFANAVEMFDYSLKYADYNRDLRMGALYWRGESRYRLGQYDRALADYTEFIRTAGSHNMDEFLTAHYNIGYIHFNKGNYSEAENWFRQYINRAGNQNAAVRGDAYNRLGDTYFVRRDFDNAMQWYDKAADFKEGSPDYALFQKAISLGVTGKQQAKIDQLKVLIERYPLSPYVDDAWYEMGRSYVMENQLTEAVRCFKTVRDNFPRSQFAKKSMLQLGLVNYNIGDLNESMVYYKRVVNEFPGTPEAEDALLGIRNIYLDQNDADGYIRYTNQIGGFARVDERQQDSLTYVSAERLYMAGNCERALIQLNNYLNSFPEGRFSLNAHYYKADCLYRNQKFNEALASYEYVASRGRSLFSEDALRYAGHIHFVNENYNSAFDYFQRLEAEADLEENRQEAIIGQMRALVKLGTPTAIIDAATRVKDNPRMAPEIIREARYLKAKAHLELMQRQNALDEFSALSSNTSSKEGAEACFRIIEIRYEEGKTAEAEERIFDFVNKGTPHQYWLARSFLVLSDIYAGRGEFFQASQYLESLLENYKGEDDDIHEMAKRKLELYNRSQED